MKILIQIKIFAENLDMPGRITGQVWKILLESGETLDISGVKNRAARFAKLDTLVLIRQKIIKEHRENLRS
jgi:hypothetical protein